MSSPACVSLPSLSPCLGPSVTAVTITLSWTKCHCRHYHPVLDQVSLPSLSPCLGPSVTAVTITLSWTKCHCRHYHPVLDQVSLTSLSPCLGQSGCVCGETRGLSGPHSTAPWPQEACMPPLMVIVAVLSSSLSVSELTRSTECCSHQFQLAEPSLVNQSEQITILLLVCCVDARPTQGMHMRGLLVEHIVEQYLLSPCCLCPHQQYTA